MMFKSCDHVKIVAQAYSKVILQYSALKQMVPYEGFEPKYGSLPKMCSRTLYHCITKDGRCIGHITM